jgi:hypothetical protein
VSSTTTVFEQFLRVDKAQLFRLRLNSSGALWRVIQHLSSDAATDSDYRPY